MSDRRITIKLSALLSGVCILDAHLPQEDVEIKGITEKSALADKDHVFAALHGIKTDGRLYVQQALKNGCRVILTDKKDGIEANYIITDNVRRAYAVMCANLYQNPQKHMKTVAVTGTNGKTTVTYMLRHIFTSLGKKCGIIGSIENGMINSAVPSDMTTPDPPELYKIFYRLKNEGAEYVFVEASSHSLALDKLSACDFDVGIITNITQDHLDFHKTTDNYLCAKAKLFTLCKNGIFNFDSEECVDVSNRVICEKYFYSLKHKTDFYAENIIQHKNMTEFDYCTEKRVHTVLKTPALFNVSNAVAALSTAFVLGEDVQTCAESLRSFVLPKGRCEVLDFGQKFSVIIDFSHTPDSLCNILKTAHTITDNGRVILVFGCGGERDKTKRPQMGNVASRYADYTIVTSDNSRGERLESIISDIMRGIDKNSKYEIISNRKEAIIHALELAKDNDVVILAGKGHEEYEITKEGKHSFSERQIVQKWFEEN